MRKELEAVTRFESEEIKKKNKFKGCMFGGCFFLALLFLLCNVSLGYVDLLQKRYNGFGNIDSIFNVFTESYKRGYDEGLLDESKKLYNVVQMDSDKVDILYINFIYAGLLSHRDDLIDDFDMYNEAIDEVTVYLYSDSTEYDRQFGHVNSEQSDIYIRGNTTGKDTINLLLREDYESRFNYVEIESILIHEFTHVLQMYVYGENSTFMLPRWYIEGMAEYESALYSDQNVVDFFMDYEDHFYDSIYVDKHLDLDKVDSYFLDGDADELEFAYMISYYYFSYLESEFGFDVIYNAAILDYSVSEAVFYEKFEDLVAEDVCVLFETWLEKYY